MFVLDERLTRDAVAIGAFPLCRLLLMNDARYPWFILVPQRKNMTEVFQLSLDDQLALWKETTLLAEVLKDTFAADKINIATLGNVVDQLHIHVIVRYRTDDAWPTPVWGKHPAKPYNEMQFSAIQEKLRMALSEGFMFRQDDEQ